MPRQAPGKHDPGWSFRKLYLSYQVAGLELQKKIQRGGQNSFVVAASPQHPDRPPTAARLAPPPPKGGRSPKVTALSVRSAPLSCQRPPALRAPRGAVTPSGYGSARSPATRVRSARAPCSVSRPSWRFVSALALLTVPGSRPTTKEEEAALSCAPS